MAFRRRRQSQEERKRIGLATQSRAGALAGIADPRLRRAIEALTSLENFDLDAFGFTSDGKLTIDLDFLHGAAEQTDPLAVKTRVSTHVMGDTALEARGSTLYYTQLPARADLGTSASTAEIIVQVNAMLEDQRKAGHRKR